MNYFTKKRLIILGIVLLVVLNLSSLATILYHNRVGKVAVTLNQDDEILYNNLNHFLQKELSLTDEQFLSVENLRREHFIRTKEIIVQLNDKRDEMLVEFRKEKPNHRKLNNLAGEIGNLHRDLKIEAIDHFLNLKKLCTPEQQEKLNILFEKIQRFEDRKGKSGHHRKGPNHRKKMNENIPDQENSN
ncbi:MAG: periplasmic heavy metal sensor [Bacteroidales bacterium]|nr:periplasmic heavy metal sensor [Bacteroidales bacterium]